MVVTTIISRCFSFFVCINSNIIIVDNCSTIHKILCRMLACSIAKLCWNYWWIYKIICIIYLSYWWCLEKCMLFVFRIFGIWCTWKYENRLLNYCKHILVKHYSFCACSCCIIWKAETSVKICLISFCKYSRVKLWFVSRCLSKLCSILMFDISVEFVFSGRCVAYSNRYNLSLVKTVIQIISSIQSLGHIRCI